VLDEIYEPGLTAEEFAEEIKRRGLCPPSLRNFFPDPADPGSTRQLEKSLNKRAVAATGGELKHRIDAIRKALKVRNTHLPIDHPERLPQIRFNRKCKHGIREMQAYRYPDMSDKPQTSTLAAETPLKKDDHVPEALGRFFKGHLLTPAQKASHTRKRKIVHSRS
jgi:hypothetical protein